METIGKEEMQLLEERRTRRRRALFAELDNRFRQATAGQEPEVIHLRIAGVALRIDCYFRELAGPIRQQLAYCCRDRGEGGEIVLRIWGEPPAPYLSSPFWARYRDGLCVATEYVEPYWSRQRLIAHDREGRIGYLLNPLLSVMEVPSQGHLLFRSIYLALLEDNRSLFHAAAVGWKGRGVLICGRGGRGKSTLALSCLVSGFQYVSDDYLILERNGGLFVHPIYSIVTLSREMQAKLPPLWGYYLHCNYNGTKDVLDISARHCSFVQRLPIELGIFPEVRPGERPSVEPMHPGQAVVHAVHSTIRQTSLGELPEQVCRLTGLLKDIPFYRFTVGEDLAENVAVLQKFLEEKM
ncbi:MAG: hypothetical protein LBT98_02585 [Puniceicoccales bacterium]|jgi:hypothetical protein|nr:hypothetical protein [Puniceicoccales bacterium]